MFSIFLVLVLCSIFTVFTVHLILLRVFGLFRQAFERQIGVIVSFLLGMLPLVIAFCFFAVKYTGFSWQEYFLLGLYLFVAYTSYSYVYFHVFNMSETARRIHILIQCRIAGELKKNEISDKYSCLDMVSNRLKRLVALKELYLRSGNYVLGRCILLLPARTLHFFRRILFQTSKR